LESSVEQAAVLDRIDIGNVGGVTEIGLTVPDQIAIVTLTHYGLRIHCNQSRIVPVLLDILNDFGSEALPR
jgi:hypothetical protein